MLDIQGPPVARRPGFHRVRQWSGVVGLCLVLLASGALAACRGPVRTDAAGPRFAEGVYDFHVGVRGASIRGNFAISGSSMVFTAPDGSCKQPTWETTSRPVEYRTVVCEATAGLHNLTFYIFLREPTRRSRWSVSYPVMARRTVCEVKSVDRNGREVCVRTGIQMYETWQRAEGTLEVRRSPGAPDT